MVGKFQEVCATDRGLWIVLRLPRSYHLRVCGRYYRKSDKQKIAEAFHVGTLPDDFVLSENYNVDPSTFQPVIRESRDSTDRELVMMRWGLIPRFAKSLADYKGISTINAKAETVQTSGMWRTPFARHRCLVPADGFYEWKKLDPKTKQPYAFALASGQPLAFAGLWEAWKEPNKSQQDVDTWLQSFSIITTTSNELISSVHDRMPVILHPKDYDRWLSREKTDQPPVDLLRPFPAEEMKAWEAHQDVGNMRNNSPEMLNSA
jgi:putative SOS response-associated peptidase YedK